ncbi:hypothetical protein [Bosea sp. UC22_33]|uniref:hypothetical protein n=1 Tax=Bosea sp. UC22_33 TaxID=3350165 RepID=UPI00366EDAEF
MGERGHTKGPWTVREYGDGDSLVIHASEDWRICFMATPGSSPNAMQRIEANAHLIAAAPDMFEVVASFPGFAASPSELNAWNKLRLAALSKATPTGEASDV